MYNDTLKSLFKDETPELINELDVIALSRGGVSKRTLGRLLDFSGMTLTQLSQLLPISKRTIQRYDESKKSSPDVSEQLIQIGKVLSRGHDVLGDKQKLTAWLNAPLFSLDQQTPMSLMDTTMGTQLILKELGRLEHGVYS
jgi:putative toxin-antitoxin system antitoxin component (TIGR02293 family)